MDKISIGADPEVFVQDTLSLEFYSAHGMIPGSKRTPHKVKRGAIQVDGMALEFNIDPAYSEGEFLRNMNRVKFELASRVPEAFQLAVGVPTARFPLEHYRAQPLEARQLGCESDYNAYTGTTNPRPKPSKDNRTMRTAGGHVHIGWLEGEDLIYNPLADWQHFENCKELVKVLDAFLGLASLQYDSDAERRKLYGQAGAFRPKPYGVEYRVLSSAWILDNTLMRGIYRQTVTCVEKFLKEDFRIPPMMQEEVQKAINTNDINLAKDLMDILTVI